MADQNQAIEAYYIHEKFEPFLKTVLASRTFGVSHRPIHLNFAASSTRQKSDRFNVSIPYASHVLDWTILFNSNCPEIGPDFDFHDDKFFADPDIDTIDNDIPSLANWDVQDPESLLKVLSELVHCYKQYQLQLFSIHEERLHMEYTMLVNQGGIPSSDVEMILLPDVNSANEAKFMIRLAIDTSKLPGRGIRTSDEGAMLVVTFQQPNWSRISPQLYLTKRLQDTFGGPSALQIPPFSRQKCIMDYIPEVKKVITDKINTLASCYEKKNNFIATMLFLQRRNVVEYDAAEFSRITILLEDQDFYFLVHILLPPAFPEVCPNVALESIYHMNNKNELVRMTIADYRYSPRWGPTRMIAAILDRIITDDVGKFKNMSIGTSTPNRRG